MRPIPPSRPGDARPARAGQVRQGRRPPRQRRVLDRTEHAGILVHAGSTTQAVVRNRCRVSNLLVAEHPDLCAACRSTDVSKSCSPTATIWYRLSSPMLAAWRAAARADCQPSTRRSGHWLEQDPTCRLLMSVPGIGVVSVLAYVSTVEDPARFAPIAISRRAHGADAQAVSVGRDRPQRQDLAVWRHARPHADV